MVLKAHVLSGCDVTSKIGTNVSALRHEPEKYLELFGETESFPDDVFRLAEKYLIQLCKSGAKSDTFSDLRAELYTDSVKSLGERQPSSSSIAGHLMRCHYVVRLSLDFLKFS